MCARYWLLIFFFCLDFGGARVHVCVCAVLAAVFSFVNLSITAVRTRKVSVFALLYSIHLLYRYKRTNTDTHACSTKSGTATVSRKTRLIFQPPPSFRGCYRPLLFSFVYSFIARLTTPQRPKGPQAFRPPWGFLFFGLKAVSLGRPDDLSAI